MWYNKINYVVNINLYQWNADNFYEAYSIFGPNLHTYCNFSAEQFKATTSWISWDNIKKAGKGAKISNRYNQVPHLTQDSSEKVTNSQLYTTNESQEVSPFPAGDHKAQINRSTQRHNKRKTEKKHIKDPQKKYCLETVSKIFYWRA